MSAKAKFPPFQWRIASPPYAKTFPSQVLQMTSLPLKNARIVITGDIEIFPEHSAQGCQKMPAL